MSESTLTDDLNPIRLQLTINERLRQHRDNLKLWESGFLDPIVYDAVEKAMVMRDLRVCITELETVLKGSQF